jgi:uncharacterized protein with PIN domain
MGKGEEKEELKFFLEGSLKGLAKWLRFFGYTAEVWEKRLEWEVIYKHKDWYFLITSPETARLLDKAGLKYALLPREDLKKQLRFLIKKLEIDPKLSLDRCSVCGEKLVPVSKESIKDRVPPRVYKFYEEFNYCPGCGRIYWEGDHIKRLRERLKKFITN